MEVKFNNEIIDLNINVDSEYIKINENQFKIKDGDTLRNCFVTENDKSIMIFIDGQSFYFDKIEEEQGFVGAGSGTSSDREEIHPPMPGAVVKVLVEVGQKVNDGDGLIIVEAMKMETTLYASISGVVKEVNVKEREQVDTDKILILVEKE